MLRRRNLLCLLADLPGARCQAGTYPESIAPTDIAPTLAALLGVAQPSGSIGRVLSEMMR